MSLTAVHEASGVRWIADAGMRPKSGRDRSHRPLLPIIRRAWPTVDNPSNTLQIHLTRERDNRLTGDMG